MSEGTNPALTSHLPFFIPGPDGSDVLMTVTIAILLLLVLIAGNLYLRLHALPERMAHRANLVQFEVVAILALLALFTHNNIFWVAALLLALVRLPDFSTPLNAIAGSLDALVAKIDRPASGAAGSGYAFPSLADPQTKRAPLSGNEPDAPPPQTADPEPPDAKRPPSDKPAEKE